MADKRIIGRPFPKGVSGNPKGRPTATRDTLCGDFIKALAEEFRLHGATAVQRVRQEEPAVFLKLIGNLLPKEATLSVDFDVSRLSDAQLADIVARDAKIIDAKADRITETKQ